MAQQSFIWTALPNGYTADESGLRLSVHARAAARSSGSARAARKNFPRSSPTGRTGRRRSRTLASISRSAGKAYRCRPRRRPVPNRVDSRLGLADSIVWKAIFKGDLIVKGFAFKDLSDKNMLSYDTGVMSDLIEQLYRDLARSATDRLPLVTEIIEAQRWRELVSMVAQIDERSVDPHTGLRDPRRQFESLPATRTRGHRRRVHDAAALPDVSYTAGDADCAARKAH